MIFVINKTTFSDEYKSKYVFDISRTSPLGNPFTYYDKKSNIAKLI